MKVLQNFFVQFSFIFHASPDCKINEQENLANAKQTRDSGRCMKAHGEPI